jgi:hypothetical protein
MVLVGGARGRRTTRFLVPRNDTNDVTLY